MVLLGTAFSPPPLLSLLSFFGITLGLNQEPHKSKHLSTETQFQLRHCLSLTSLFLHRAYSSLERQCVLQHASVIISAVSYSVQLCFRPSISPQHSVCAQVHVHYFASSMFAEQTGRIKTIYYRNQYQFQGPPFLKNCRLAISVRSFAAIC